MAFALTLSRSWVVPRMAATRRCRRLLAAMLAGAVLVGPALYLAWNTIRRGDLDLGAELADLGLEGWPWLLFMAYFVTVNPVLEESFWRGYLGSPARLPVWSDVFYAGYHVLVIVLLVGPIWVAGGFVGLAGAGWLWRQLARDCGGLLIPVASHAAGAASLMLAAHLLAW